MRRAVKKACARLTRRGSGTWCEDDVGVADQRAAGGSAQWQSLVVDEIGQRL